MQILIEIGVEELPAIPFLKEYENILPKWKKILEANSLNANFEFEFTPRRVVLFCDDFAQKQPDFIRQHIGAPKKVAIDESGKFTKAAIAFANKCGIKPDELKFANIESKEVLYFEEKVSGKASKELLPAMIDEWLKSLNFGRSMRWGEGKFEFIRPIRSLSCQLGEENLEFEIFGIKSQKGFYPHRKFGYEKLAFSDIADYFEKLAKNGVILRKDDRKNKILAEFKQLEEKHGFVIQKDSELLDEIITITESPKVLLGKFEDDFLRLPPEVIITSMKTNQRYFPVFTNSALSSNFVLVSNAISSDDELIVRGNEKVLRARLSDAMFFWESDCKSGLNPQKLKNITFMQGLGSVYDKELREAHIATQIGEIYAQNIDELKRAVMLSKADLVSGMVGEFSELQGVMGGYYAKAQNESQNVIKALRDQYLPSGENSPCPEGLFASIVSLSNKFDTLLSLFSINKIPSGSKDPYALRRAANGIIKIILNQKLELDIKATINKLAQNYQKFDTDLLVEFILDRLYTMYEANPSIIKSCINSGQRDILRLDASICALEEIAKKSDFKDKFETFKRVSNIIKDLKVADVDENLLVDEAEKSLYMAFKSLNLDIKDTKNYLCGLFGLKDSIDLFFQKVMINVEDEKIRANRQSLVGEIYQAFLKVADIKEIVF